MSLLWVDLETTGLDPRGDRILEIAAIVTNDDLDSLGQYTAVINPWPSLLDASAALAEMDQVVHDMHSQNGLIEEVWDRGIPLEDAEQRLMELVAGRGMLTLAGSSVHFDRGFLARWMPGVMSQLSHRHIDVSVVREMAKKWRPGLMEQGWPAWLDARMKMDGTSNHRALADIQRSLDLAEFFRETVFIDAF